MENILIVGFIFGLRHAIESDHFAAVASLTTQSKNVGQAVKVGLVWGLGHTLTLFLIGGIVLILGSAIPPTFAATLEWIVGLMLLLLGADLIRKVIKSKIHFHTHTHHDGVKHFHAHSHEGETGSHEASLHYHQHRREFPYRAFIVGLVHGLAGSAALILLTLGSVETKTLGLLYILIFGLGSIIGMGLLSLIIAIPILKVKDISRIYNPVCIAAGLFTMAIGLIVVTENSAVVLSLI